MAPRVVKEGWDSAGKEAEGARFQAEGKKVLFQVDFTTG
jgi:hypothetical protein